MPQLLIIRHSEDRDYDRYIMPPRGMELPEAQDQADRVISNMKARAKELDADLYWEEIEDELIKRGFREVTAWFHCEEEV